MPRPVPEYMKIRTFVYNLAMRGDTENGRLPSESELCSLFKVSRITVREALQELVRSRTILTRKGMGTFVHPDFAQQKPSPWCIGYLRFSGRCATNQLSGIFEDCIEQLGMSYELLFHSHSEQSEKQLLSTVRSLSGIIWDGYVEKDHGALARTLSATGIPLLLLSQQQTEHDTLLLDSDQEAATVVAYARSHGHRNILFVSQLGTESPENFLQLNQTYSAVYRRLSPDGKIPLDHFCSPVQLSELVASPHFTDRFTMIYSRRTLVRSTMEILKHQGLHVPEQISYLVFEQSTPLLFNGLSPSCIDNRPSLQQHILQWLQRRIIQGDKDGVFFARQTVTVTDGDTVRDLRP